MFFSVSFYRISILIIFFGVIFSFAAASQDSEPADLLKLHVDTLSSRAMKGRHHESGGDKLAAAYISSEFTKYGLASAYENYLQEVSVAGGLEPGEGCSISFDVLIPRPGLPKDKWRKRTKNWELYPDWLPSGQSKSGSATGELAFVGYGISAPELNYDDYTGIDVAGKIVIMLTNSPEGFNRKGDFAAYTSLEYKTKNAVEHKAAAIMFIKINSDSANIFNPLASYNVEEEPEIIAVQANRTSLAKFFPKNRQLFPMEQKLNKTRTPESFVLPNVTVSINVELKSKTAKTSNVVGIIRGESSPDEYIVVGAHYDHLGMQERKDRVLFSKAQIYNGADDNASGVAVLLELARRFSINKPAKSIIFAAFAAGEENWKGSKAFIESPPVPKEKISCMIDLNMVGRLRDNTLDVFGMKSSALFERIVDSLFYINNLDIGISQNGIGKSDHVSFYDAGIPSILLTTGMHEDYHTPNDIARKIHYKGLEKAADFAHSLISSLDKSGKPLFRKADGIFENLPPAEPPVRAVLGIIPDLEADGPGISVKGVKSGSPAHKARIKRGDIITGVDGKEINNYYTLIRFLRGHKAGDTVSLKLLRDEEETEMEVTLD